MVEEATIVGFRVLLNTEGNLVFESEQFPNEHVNEVFRRESDRNLIHPWIRGYERETKDMDQKIQKELTSIFNMP